MGDAEFVRKADAVMKAAGVVDASVGYLFKNAPSVFLQALKSIYQISAPNANKGSDSQKVEFVISELWRRTGFHILEKVTSDMVCRQKDFRAIGVLVGILYEEGQRLWKERMQEMHNAPPKYITSSHRQLKKSEDKRRGTGADGGSRGLAESKSMPAGVGMGMTAVESLTTLETMYLDHIDSERGTSGGANEADVKMSKKTKEKEKKKRRNRIPGEKSKKEKEKEKKEEAREKAMLRPGSAPSYRTYEVGRDAKGNVIRPEAIGTLASSPPKPKTTDGPPVDYTYDMLSGRKISIVQARRQSEAASNSGVLNARQIRELYLAKKDKEREQALKPPVGPTTPQWPGQRTGVSTEQWVKKMNKVRKDGEPDPESKKVQNIKCIELPAYASMQRRDVLISVEHCHNCSMHNSTLRHDEDGYRASADTILQFLGKVCHASNKMIRVGLCRFKSKVTCKKEEKADTLRIGAFEIQVAIRQDDNKLLKETLHSKCTSGRWPSRQVVEKRLSAFLSKADLPDQPIFEPQTSEFFNNVYNDGVQEYPCGVGPWLVVPCSVPGWSYPTDRVSSKSAGASVPTLAPDVCWIYDARRIGSLVWVNSCTSLEDEDSDEERVLSFETPLLGIVINYHPLSDRYDVALKYLDRTVSVSAEDGLAVAQNEKVTFIESITASQPRATKGSMPPALQTVLASLPSSIRGAFVNFWKGEDDDPGNDCDEGDGRCIITRRTLFKQLITLVNTLKDSPAAGVFLDPKTKTHRMKSRSKVMRRIQFIDVEESRSEAILDYAFTWFGIQDADGNPVGQVDMRALDEAALEQDIDYDPEASVSRYAASEASTAPNSPIRASVDVNQQDDSEPEPEPEAEPESEAGLDPEPELEVGATPALSAPTPISAEPQKATVVTTESVPTRQSAVRESVDPYGDDTFYNDDDEDGQNEHAKGYDAVPDANADADAYTEDDYGDDDYEIDLNDEEGGADKHGEGNSASEVAGVDAEEVDGMPEHYEGVFDY